MSAHFYFSQTLYALVSSGLFFQDMISGTTFSLNPVVLLYTHLHRVIDWIKVVMGRGRAKRKPAPHDRILDSVLTASEVATIYNYARRTVYDWCLYQHVSARKSGDTWLVSRSSVDAYLNRKSANLSGD